MVERLSSGAEELRVSLGCRRICLSVCLNMNVLVNSVVKTITIRDEVYKKLLSVKRENESFSELLEKLVEGADSVETLKKLRGCVEFKDKGRMVSEIYASRAERRV